MIGKYIMIKIKSLFISIITFSTSHSSYSQWTYGVENDPFNGKEVYAFGIGSGGEFPYEKPTLVFRNRSGKKEIYITGAGSVVCDNPYLDVSFGDPKKVETFNLGKSVNNDSGFLNMNEVKKIYNLITQLKSNSTAYFRFGTDCSMNRFKISLSGSANAISKIFNNAELNSIKNSIEQSEKALIEKQKALEKKRDIRKENLLLIKNAFQKLNLMLENDFYLENKVNEISNLTGDKIDNVEIRPYIDSIQFPRYRDVQLYFSDSLNNQKITRLLVTRTKEKINDIYKDSFVEVNSPLAILYDLPSDSSINFIKLEKGDSVLLVDDYLHYQKYLKVAKNEKIGFVHKAYINLSNAYKGIGVFYKTSQSVFLRPKPDSKSSPLEYLQMGTKVELLSDEIIDYKYIRVKTDNNAGFIDKSKIVLIE